MKIVSSNDDPAIKKQHEKQKADGAVDRLKWKTRELTANLLRIAADAGADHKLMSQVADLVDAINDAWAFYDKGLCDYPPPITMSQALQDRDWRKDDPAYANPNREEDMRRWWRDGTMAELQIRDSVIRESLRVIAAQLVRQPTQEAKATDSLERSIRKHEETKEFYIQENRRLEQESYNKAARQTHGPGDKDWDGTIENYKSIYDEDK